MRKLLRYAVSKQRPRGVLNKTPRNLGGTVETMVRGGEKQ